MMNKKTLKNDERAVSPVIAEILMVAIVVILAAIIGAYVFGMGGIMTKTYLVGATASQSGESTLSVTYNGGPDDNMVNNLTFRGIDSEGTVIAWDATQDGVLGAWVDPTLTDPVVGDTIISTTSGTPGQDHILVAANFVDGTTQLIVDTYV